MQPTPARLLLCLGLLVLMCVLLPAQAGVHALAASASVSPYAQAILADAPQAYWRLDETSGTTFADSTGHGNTSTLNAGVTLGTPGALVSDPTGTSTATSTA